MLESVPYVCNMFSFDITYQCPLRCRHCYNRSGSHHFGDIELTDGEIREMIEDAAKLHPKILWICGGEPLLRQQLIYDIFSLLPSSCERNMLTNGFSMTEDCASHLKEAGVGTVQISLDGARRETHNWLRNNSSAFDKALESIRILKDTGIHTSVACTPFRGNFEEIDDMIDLCLSLHADELKFQKMMNLGRASAMYRNFLTSDEYEALARKIEDRKTSALKQGLKLEWGDTLAHVNKLLRGCASEDLNISAYGDILLSPYLPITLGNIRRHPLTDYLANGLTDIGNNSFIQKAVSLLEKAVAMNVHSCSALPDLFAGQNIEFDLFEHHDMEEYGHRLTMKYGL